MVDRLAGALNCAYFEASAMTQAIIEAVEKAHLKSDLPEISVGDTVDCHLKIVEGNKERIQKFSGVVLRIQGRGIAKAILVRRIVANEGVERLLPLHSPRVAKIEVVRGGHVRRAKLYYLRDRVGKSRRIKDSKVGEVAAATETAPAAETKA
jgi:large subunit ribosomal protein L19